MLVGREAEMAALRATLEGVERGEAVTVLIGGDAGVGKTRLLREFAAEARDAGALVLVGHCVEVGDGELPYAPIAGALRGLASALREDELAAALGPAREELARLAPDLGGDATLPAPSGLGRARLFELLLGTFARTARDRPLVVAIEDLHWADRSTRDVLAFLARNAGSERLALVATYRTDLHRAHPLRPLLAELERDPRVRRIALHPFSREEFAAHVATLTATAPADLDALYARSEGNAFFTEELLASGGAALPPSLREALLVRLATLSPAGLRVVRAAAVAGRRVDQRLLAAIADLDDDALAGALRDAVAAQVLVPDEHTYEFRHALLREAAYADVLPGEREALHHALARELEARPELAATGSSAAAEIAHHWHAARERDRALPASLRAGEAAEAVYAFAEAQRHYERALALDPVGIGARAAAAANAAGDHVRAAELAAAALEALDEAAEPVLAALLLSALGHYLWDAGRGEEAGPIVERAVALVPPAPTRERALVLEQRARLLLLTGRVAEAAGQIDEAIAIAQRAGARDVETAARVTRLITLHVRPELAAAEGREALAFALATNDPVQTHRAYVNTAEALDQAGRVAEAVELGLEGIEVTSAHGVGRARGSQLVGVTAYRELKLGRLADAQSRVERTLRLRPSGIPAVRLHQTRALIAARSGDVATTEAAIREARENAREPGAGLWSAPTDVAAAELALWRGDAPAARRIVHDALAGLAAAEFVLYSAPLYALGAWAEVECALRARTLRRADEERAATAAVAALAARFDEQLAVATPPEAVAWRAQFAAEVSRLGDSDATDGRRAEDRGEVPALWQTARERWEALGFPFPAAWCAWREAEARLAAGGDRDRARALLADARAAAGDAARLVEEIDALTRRARLALRDEPEPPRAEVAGAAAELGLTPRELDVLGLLAEGRTNRQIGEALFIAEKTVGLHVSRVLAKLDAANRGEAVAIARRLGIAE